MESLLKEITQIENEAMMDFLEQKSIENKLPIDVMTYVIRSVSRIDFYPYPHITPDGKAEVVLRQEFLPLEDALNMPRDEKMDTRLLRREHNSIGTCFKCIHNISENNWKRKCQFSLRTHELNDFPHDEYAEWFCPYYDTDNDSDSQIENLFNMYMEGRKNE